MSDRDGCTTLSRLHARDEKSLTCMCEQRSTPSAGHRCRPASTGIRRLTALALAAIVAAMSAMPAAASDRWFTVEVIVFDELPNQSLHDELWPADPGEPSLQGAIELAHSHEGDSGGTPHAFRLVNRSELSLLAVWNKLRGSARYRPFLHAGWRLPGLPSSAARPAHVSANLVDGRFEAAQREVAERPTVHGTVTVSLGRYLEVAVDLLYHRPSSDEAPLLPAAPSRFRLVAERRMRSGELHYIDHPVFGVLMQITPFQPGIRSTLEG